MLERIINKNKVNLKNYKMLVVPVRAGNNYWQLVVADMANDTFHLLGAGKPNPGQVKQVVNYFAVFLGLYLNLNKVGRV